MTSEGTYVILHKLTHIRVNFVVTNMKGRPFVTETVVTGEVYGYWFRVPR